MHALAPASPRALFKIERIAVVAVLSSGVMLDFSYDARYVRSGGWQQARCSAFLSRAC